MADEQNLQTVPVIVTNFTENRLPQSIQNNLRDITDGVKSLQDIYGDKNKFKNFERKFSSLEDNIKNIYSLLKSKPLSESSTTGSIQQRPQFSISTQQSSTTQNPDIIEIGTKLDNVIGLLESILNKEYCKCNGRGGSGNGSENKEERRNWDLDEEDNRRDNSLREALQASQEQEKKENADRDKAIKELPPSIKAIKEIGKDLIGVVTKGFSDTFSKWDDQIKHLKETGMGAKNAAELNRMTSRTMWATEDLVGWNVSIDKAIKATNTMMAAGMNPRYVRENNKQFIMGLTSVGLQLQPDTIREFGNAVFDATHVKELTEGWAKLINPNTENAISADELSRYLGSDEYKQMASVIMRTGEYNTEDIQRTMQEALTNAVKAGFTSKDALAVAQVETQARLGGGAFGPLPSNVQSLIGSAQITGTFTDLKHLSENLLQSTKVMQSDMQARSRVLSANAGLAMGGDYTLYSNLMMNDGHTRRIATQQEVAEGQYEGALVRAGKYLADLLPSESTGAYAQQLTGDSSFFTKSGGKLLNGIWDELKGGGQIFYLKQIANNTAKNVPGGGGLTDMLSSKFPKLGNFLSKAGPIALGIGAVASAVTVVGGTVSLLYDESEQAQKRAEEAERTAVEYMEQERALQQQLTEAKKNGDQKTIDLVQKQLDQIHKKTDQQLDSVIDAQELASDKEWAGNAGIIGGTVGLIAGGIAALFTGVGIPAGLAMIAAGIGLGGVVGAVGTDIATSTSGPNYDEERDRLRSSHGYAEGGLVEEEQIATIGEGNKPELILPLTKPDRMATLIAQAQNAGYITKEAEGVSKIQFESDRQSNPDILNIIDIITKQLGYLENINNLMVRNFGDKANEDKEKKDSEMVYRNQMFVSNLSIPVKGLISSSKPIIDSDILTNPQDVVYQGISPISGSIDSLRYSNNNMMSILNRLDENDKERIQRENARMASGETQLSAYANGGLVDEEQKALIGENNQPELILPLTNPYRTEELIEEAVNNPSTNEQVADILSKPSFVEQKILYMQAVEDYNKKLKDNPRLVQTLLPDLLSDVLQSSVSEDTNSFHINLENFNPFGLKNQLGELNKYDSMEIGIQEFVSSIEKAFDRFNNMSYKQQLQELKDQGYISNDEYSRTAEKNKDKLVESLNELNKSVQESNRISRNSRPIPNLTPMQQRRY